MTLRCRAILIIRMTARLYKKYSKKNNGGMKNV